MQPGRQRTGATIARALVLVVAVAWSFVGCTRHSHLKRVTLWEGDVTCTACQAQAVTLWPSGPTRVALKPDSLYTARLDLDAAGDADRCVFRFLSGSWELPSHSFNCPPEQDVMYQPLRTVRLAHPSGGDTLWLRVDILSSTETTGIELLLDTQSYAVDWIQ